MSANISGRDLRDSILNKLANPAAVNIETVQIEALATAGNRELLVAISLFKPRSISELSAIVARQQPNVSRSLAALTRAKLVELVADGRASVPTLSEIGARKAEELAGSVDLAGLAPLEANEGQFTPILSADLVARPGDLQSDEAPGQLMLFGRHGTARDLDLNEVATHLLRHWWRAFYRLDDPFRLCALDSIDGTPGKTGALFILALGARIELFARPTSSLEEGETRLRTELSESSATELLLDRLVRPVAAYLEKGRRFNRPAHALLRRLEDVMAYEREANFAKTAGALGLSPHDVSDALANSIRELIAMMPDQSARLDFASSTIPETFEASIAWAKGELRDRKQTNRFAGLRGFRPAAKAGNAPAWRVGKTYAEQLRNRLKLADDQPIGGVEGLKQLFGGDGFRASAIQEDALRGIRGGAHENPVLVVQDHGPAKTAFLLARAIGDYLAYDDPIGPITELKTERQALGRAFGAELLAPSDGVIHMIQEENKTQMAVAHHYGVDVSVVGYQYANHA